MGSWVGPLTTSTYWRRAVPPLTWRKLLSCMRQSEPEEGGTIDGSGGDNSRGEDSRYGERKK